MLIDDRECAGEDTRATTGSSLSGNSLWPGGCKDLYENARSFCRPRIADECH